jgi:3'-phosphoadenosine 5'-phosphosulfate sulfotransferase (PAPS reductase)/FAD synthetase
MQSQAVVPIQVIRPDTDAVLGFVRANGEDAMYRSLSLRKTCCRIRKMEPLRKVLLGQKAWVTGLRQEQSEARAQVLHHALAHKAGVHAFKKRGGAGIVRVVHGWGVQWLKKPASAGLA